MILTSLSIPAAELASGTGWEVKPEGACRGEVCVPLPPEARVDGQVSIKVLAERLAMPLVREDSHGLWVLGPAGLAGRALQTAQAPELRLPDWKGGEFSLRSLRGQKIFLLAWASW